MRCAGQRVPPCPVDDSGPLSFPAARPAGRPKREEASRQSSIQKGTKHIASLSRSIHPHRTLEDAGLSPLFAAPSSWRQPPPTDLAQRWRAGATQHIIMKPPSKCWHTADTKKGDCSRQRGECTHRLQRFRWWHASQLQLLRGRGEAGSGRRRGRAHGATTRGSRFG